MNLTVTDIQQLAKEEYHYTVNWETIDHNPVAKKEMLETLTTQVANIPVLESLYNKLQNGVELKYDDEVVVPQDQIVEYTENIAENLFAAYQMRMMLDNYNSVNNLLNSI